MKLIRKLILYLVIFTTLMSLLLLFFWTFINRWPWPLLLPQNFSLRAIEMVLQNHQILQLILSSVLLSFLVTCITLCLSLPAARALAFYSFKGKRMIEMIVLLPLIIPMLSVSMGIHISFLKWGLANHISGVILIHVLPGIPYGVIILKNGFLKNGLAIENQSRSLGASVNQTFWHITLPMLMPSVMVASTIVYIISFSQYFITFVIGGGQVVTYAMYIFPIIQAGDRTLSALLSIIFMMTIGLVLLLSGLSSQYFIKRNHIKRINWRFNVTHTDQKYQ